ncbi:restriction endonuclease subunit S [Glaesserella parasuis]|nr:restriction endonuclease subunit S [Glaesserella parasuis]MCT8659172.1 restriction endonuclease subunit S [Glaesserella parasuis]MCT8667050.1 restriction endonuclease subunit S [Glaesserella parasuis]MCT8670962.1 restriction endonuclease subunit S [Glaesserella parasuis]MCT8800881.1 restriction endonuclease subunit S [Glaesserella parasuis]
MSSWKEYKLGEIATFYNGRAYKNTEFKVSGTPIVRIQNLTGEGKIVYSDLNLDENKYIDYGDLIYAWSATFGPYIWKGEKSIYHYHIWKIICNEELLDKKYFYYKLKQISDNLKDSGGNGSIFVHITKAFMENFKVKIPSLNEQKRVSSILAYLDEKIQLNTQINQTLEQIAQTIFKSWFIDFDPVHAKANALASGQTTEQATQAAMTVISGKNTQELHRLQTANPEQYQQLWEIADAFPSGFDEEGVPWGWEERYLKDVCNIVYGKGLPKNKLTEKGFYVFGANGVIGFYDSYTYEKPQVLIGCRGTVGQVTLSYPYSFVTNNSLVIEYENSCVSMYYLEKYLSNINLKEISSGSVQPQITIQNMSKVKILIPNIEILNFYSEKVKEIYDKRLNHFYENQSLSKVRDLLLPKLLSGEV